MKVDDPFSGPMMSFSGLYIFVQTIFKDYLRNFHGQNSKGKAVHELRRPTRPELILVSQV